MSEFLAMNGYGAYVWSAYGITLVVLVLNVWAGKRALRQNLSKARRTTIEQTGARQPTVTRID
jgi:heme exporter protein D